MRKFQWASEKRKLLATVMVAGLAGACSSEVTRFDNDPFKNPFRSRAAFDPVQTNSINRQGSAQTPRSLEPVRSAAVSTQPLPAPNAPIMGANPMGGNPARVSTPLTTGSVGAPNYPALGPVAPRPSTVLGPTGDTAGWSAVGGTPVTVREGESLNTLASRYNVPVNALMAVNGISAVNQVRPGQQVMIPAYSPVAAAPAPSARSVIQRSPAAVPSQVSMPTAAAVPSVPTRAPVAVPSQPMPSQTMPSQPMPTASVRSTPAIPARVAEAPRAAETTVRNAAPTRQVVPAGQTDAEKRAAAKLEAMKRQAEETKAKQKAEAAKKIAAAKLAEQKAKAEADKIKAEKAKALAASKKAKTDDEPTTTASLPDAKPVAARNQPMPDKESTAAAPLAEANDSPTFRWPAKGRVISGFGARGTGGANDGINIAVPEGTPVRAAEGGTVVHADDALKGYGKLVLIRHPNGYVSVYAHNSELKVKRGESVRRGQVIASSGQTGNVTAPQLHFEIRKGATPVDPNKYLSE
jgi:murein DD-endopeptidase MepM/ murein hydrolase activator NlpD